jgi:hypothetical protein
MTTITRFSLARLIRYAQARGYVGDHDPIGAAAFVKGYMAARYFARSIARIER